MKHSWVIVADAAHARVFEITKPDNRLHEINKLQHAESRMYASQLRTGGKGAVIDSAGSGQHQPDPQVSQSEKHAAHFARELAAYLYQQRTDDAFAHLVVVAEPKFLGHLRTQLDQPTTQLVSASIDKNWVQHDARQIEQLLQDTL